MTNPDRSRARFWLGIGLPAAILAAAYIPFLILRSELPASVASHFDSSGRADDSMSVAVFLLTTGVMVAVGLGLSIGLALRRGPTPPTVAATVGFLGPFIAALGGSILATTAVAQSGIDSWADAPNAWWNMVVGVGIATAAGIAGARCGSHLADNGGSAASDTPVMQLGDDEQAVWTASLRSTPLFLLGAAFGVLGLVLITTAPIWTGVAMLASSVPLTALASLHVRVDRTGLQVKYSGLPWPTTHVAVERIVSASIIDVRPMEWGGWGYRGSLKLMRQAAVVHRAGLGIRLDLVDGKVFVVTIDEPETGVALLNAQVQRQVRINSA